MSGDVWLLECPKGGFGESLLQSMIVVYFVPRDVHTHLGVLLTAKLDTIRQEPHGEHQSAAQDELVHSYNNKMINKF